MDTILKNTTYLNLEYVLQYKNTLYITSTIFFLLIQEKIEELISKVDSLQKTAKSISEVIGESKRTTSKISDKETTKKKICTETSLFNISG